MDMRLANPNTMLSSQDVQNHHFGIKTRFLDGRTPIQALLTSLVEAGDRVTNYKAEDDVVSAYTNCRCRCLLSLHSHLTWTYKANKYKNTLFGNCGCYLFRFVSKENAEHFTLLHSGVCKRYTPSLISITQKRLGR